MSHLVQNQNDRRYFSCNLVPLWDVSEFLHLDVADPSERTSFTGYFFIGIDIPWSIRHEIYHYFAFHLLTHPPVKRLITFCNLT